MGYESNFFGSTGNLTKSKSFNDSDKRPKVLRLDELPRNQFSTETCHKKKSCAVTVMGKSLSFNDASYGRSNSFGPKMKRIPPKFSEDGDSKRLRCTKEPSSVEMTSNSGFKRPRVGLPSDSSCVSASLRDMKFASHGESISSDGCGTKGDDSKAVHTSRDSGNSLNLGLRVDLKIPYSLFPTPITGQAFLLCINCVCTFVSSINEVS